MFGKTNAEAERFARMAGRVAGFGFWRRDFATGASDWSDSMFDLHGVRRAPGQTCLPDEAALALYASDDRPKLSEVSRHIRASGEPCDVKVRLRRADDGRERVVEYHAEADFGPSGEVVGLIGVMRDVTEDETLRRQLIESETLYRTLVEASPDVVARYSPDYVIQYMSPAIRRYGWDPEEVIGLKVSDIVPPEDWLAIFERTRHGIAAGRMAQNIDRTHRLKTADGGHVWVESFPSVILDEAGKTVAVIAQVRDITERRAAIESLVESEAHFRLLTENASDVIGCYGRDAVFTYLSPSVTSLLGYAPDELIGRRTFAIMHPDDIEPVKRLFESYLAAGPDADPIRFEYRAFRKDGALAWLEAQPRAVYDAAGELVEFQDVVRDISARKAMETALAESEARYRATCEKVTDIVLNIDAAGRLRLLSPSVTDVLGFTAEAATGSDAAAFIHPRDLRKVRAAYARIARGEGGERVRFRAHRIDGRWVWLESNPTPVFADGRLVEFVDVARDVSARVELELELRRAKEAAESTASAKAEFLANMSHEIRTPLTAIIGYSGLLAVRSDLTAEARRFAERIRNAGQGLLAVVNDILDFSRLEAGEVAIERQVVRTSEVLVDAIELLRPQADAKGLALDLEARGEVPERLSLDPARLRQVLLNLVGNAVKFTETGGVHVVYAYDREAGRLEVRIRDTGPGLNPDQQAKLFQRFSQVDGTSSRRHGGTGLGLAISRALVEAMGGGVGVRSTPGAGSTFHFWLPAPAEATSVRRRSAKRS